jgi:putative serine protease PepD
MTQTTNNENDHGYAWARRPGASSDYTAPAPAADANADFVSPSGRQQIDTNTTQVVPVPPADRDAPSPPSGWPQAYQAPTSAAAPQAPTYSSDNSYPSAYSPTGSYSSDTGSGAYSGGSAYPQGGTATAAPTASWMPGEAFGHTESGSAAGGLPPTVPPTGRRQPRRPGWGGVLAVGAGAAALASLLTAGIVLQTQDDTSTTLSPTTSRSTVKAPVTSSNAGSPDWGAVSAAVTPSVVAVKVAGQNGSGQGSGVLLDKEGRIVTNNHVVSGTGEGSTVEVVLSDGRTYKASVLGTDSSTDLAVIKISNPPNDLTPAVLGNSSEVAVGDSVMAVGNPLGLAGTVTTGIVSATDRPTTTQAESNDPTSGGGENVVTNAIQTDAAVTPGNSGGALVDAQGRVIGIPSSIASLGSGSALGESAQSGSIGLGFAIPIDEARDVANQLIKSGSVSHAWLGVGPDDGTATNDGATRDAAILRDIIDGGPAEKAGLKANDAVIAVDGEPVNSAVSLVGQLRERQAGTAVTLTVVRDGKASDIKVTLGTKPAQN